MTGQFSSYPGSVEAIARIICAYLTGSGEAKHGDHDNWLCPQDSDSANAMCNDMAEEIVAALPSATAQGSADCGEVAELRAKLDLAFKGIRDFTEGNYDNPRQYRPEPCKHGQRWYEGCQSCDDAFMEQLASSLSSTPEPAQTEPRHQAIEACAALVENFPESILQFVERPGGPPGNHLRSVTRKDLAAAIRSLSNIPSCDDGSKAFPVSSETSVPASPPGGSGAENPTTNSSVTSTHEPAQTAQVPATQENIFDCLYANVYADNDGVAGISAFIEDLMERFDVRLKASAVPSTEGK